MGNTSDFELDPALTPEVEKKIDDFVDQGRGNYRQALESAGITVIPVVRAQKKPKNKSSVRIKTIPPHPTDDPVEDWQLKAWADSGPAEHKN